MEINNLVFVGNLFKSKALLAFLEAMLCLIKTFRITEGNVLHVFI